MRKSCSALLAISLLVFVLSGFTYAQEMTPQPAPTQLSTPAEALAQPAGIMEVAFKDGKLSVKAEKADLPALLKKVSEMSGIAIDIGEGVSGKVTISFVDLAVEEGINRILSIANSKNYASIYEKVDTSMYRLFAVTVVAKGNQEKSALSLEVIAVPISKEGLKEYLDKRRIGTKWEIDWSRDELFNRLDSLGGLLPVSAPISSANEGKAYIDRLINELSAFWGINIDQIKFSIYEEQKDGYLYRYPQSYKGIPVEGGMIGGWLRKLHEDGFHRIGMQNSSYPDVSIDTEPKLTSEEAVNLAEGIYTHEKYYRDWPEMDRPLRESAQLLIYPLGIPEHEPTKYEYHLVWKVHFPRFTYYIDAHSPKLIKKKSNVRQFTVSGRLAGQRYGQHIGIQYIDDSSIHVDGLPNMYLWSSSETDHKLPPPSGLRTQADGNYSVTETQIPLYGHLQTERIRIYYGDSAKNFLTWQSDIDGFNYTFSDTNGYQPNIYLQLYRGINTLMTDNVDHNEPPTELSVYADYPLYDAEGETIDNTVIRYASNEAVKSSDIILHELIHAAVYTKHNGYIGEEVDQEGVGEGLSDYFACRINSHQLFEGSASYDLVNTKQAQDSNRDEVIDDYDWAHYSNGKVIASILWDLSREKKPEDQIQEAIEDKIMWEAIDIQYLVKDQFSVGDIYEAIRKKLRDMSLQEKYNLLWYFFGAHGVNLWARPGERLNAQGIMIPGVELDWLDYYGISNPSYSLYRKYEDANGNFSDPELVASNLTDSNYYDKVFTEVGAKYYYWVRPNANPDLDTNVAACVYGALPAPRNLRITNVQRGLDGNVDIHLRWDPVTFPSAAQGKTKAYRIYSYDMERGIWNASCDYTSATETTIQISIDRAWAIRVCAIYFSGNMFAISPPSNEVRYPASLDLTVVMQSYFPYCNYTAGYLRRYKKSLDDIFRSLEASEVPAGSIHFINPSCLDDDTGPISDYLQAQIKLGTWPDISSSKIRKSTLLDSALAKAITKFPFPKHPTKIYKTLIFTNWYHYDKEQAANQPPLSPDSNGWEAPYQDTVSKFPKPSEIELDAVDFYWGSRDAYTGIITNADKREWRFSFDIKNYLFTDEVSNPNSPPPLGDKKGYLVLQNPYEYIPPINSDVQRGIETLDAAKKKLLFPWINEEAAKKYRLSPGTIEEFELSVDDSMARLSIGVDAQSPGVDVSLVRPNGIPVALHQSGDQWLTDDPSIKYVGGGESHSYLIESPEVGTWKVAIQGSSITGATEVDARAYTSSAYRVDEVVPGLARPGEAFPVSVKVGGASGLTNPSVRMEFIRETGSLYEIGNRVSVPVLADDGQSSDGSAGDGSYGGHHLVSGYEGPLKYRVALDGLDQSGNPVHRESDGNIFVRGDPPHIEPVGPFGITGEFTPLIQARVEDDAAIGKSVLRLDGKTFTAKYEASTKLLSFRPSSFLEAGLHVVEVTASDTIDQEGTPEVWTFTVGPVLKAADPTGDDYGPGYYTYPTDVVSFPASSFDLREFRVGHNAGTDLFDPSSQERVTFLVKLGALAAAQRDMNQVVDIYIDTDGLSGSGRTDTLPGRNVLLASQDGWEYVLTLNADGAVLRDAAGGETSLALEYLPSAKSLVAYVPFSRLGLDDPAKLSTWGYAVLVMGRDGLNAGGVKEVTTLGGAAAFGGGSEGSIDPGVIDLLAPSGMTQEAMLSSYSIPEGRRATISAFRFGGSQGLDTVTPVISGVTPFGAWAIDPPTFACTVSDDRGVDPASITLTVDGVAVAHELLSITGTQRRRQVSYTSPSPFGGGEHVYSFAASDLSGNRESETRSFAIGTVARLALICGRGRQEGMVVGGDCRVEGTALGQSYFVESSPDGVSWATVAQGTANIVDGFLGEWLLGSLADGSCQLRLRVLHPGGEVADSLGLVIDNTAPSGGIELAGGAAASSEPDIKGVADLVGMAADVHFKEWILEAGEGSDPSSWRTISGSSTQAPSGTLLAPWNTSGVSDFSWTLRLTAEDAAGNRSVKTAYVHVDNTPPRASIIAPASGASVGANTLAEVTGDVYDARLGAWTLEWGEGSAPAVWQSLAAGGSTAYGSRLGTWDAAGLVPGSYSLRLTAQDKAGSVVTVSSAVTLTAAPMVRISGVSPAQDNFVKGTVTVNGTTSFPEGGSYIVEVSADEVTWTQVGSGTVPVTDGILASWNTATVVDGSWRVRLTSLDGLGGTASSELVVTVDNTLPTAAVTAPLEGAAVAGKAEIAGTAYDVNLSWYTVEWGAGAAPTSWTDLATFSPAPVQAGLLALWETRGLEVGAYALRLFVADKAGGVSEVIRSVTINTDTIPPSVSIDAPLSGEIITAASIQVLGSVSDTALSGWSLASRPFVNGSWGTETVLASGIAPIAGLIHTWDVSTLEGEFKLSLSGTDASGNRAEKSVEVVFVHVSPYAAIESVGGLSFPAGAGSGGVFLSGLVEVMGTAVAPALSSYMIEASADGVTWNPVVTGASSVTHGLLASWDTSTLGDADYHLRLRVVDASLAEASDQVQVPLDNFPPTVSLIEPGPNASAGTSLVVRGTASDAHFREYLLEVASAQSPDIWMPFGRGLHPVSGGVLGRLVVNADVAAFKELLAVGGGGDLLWAILDMETSADGRIFVSEDGKSVIRVYSHQGEYLYDIGGNVTEPGWSMHPMGLFVKGEELFVADKNNHRVQVFDLEGNLKRMVPLPWDPAVDPPPSPLDVVVADDGRLYVGCEGGEDIRVLTRSGEQTRVIAPVVNGVSWPARGWMDIDAGGNIYVVAATRYAAMKLSPEGEFLRSFGERGTDVV